MKKTFVILLLCVSLLTAPWLHAGIQPAHNVPLVDQAPLTYTAQPMTKTPEVLAYEKAHKNDFWLILLYAAVTLGLTFFLTKIPRGNGQDVYL